jgi:hypothetical protein
MKELFQSIYSHDVVIDNRIFEGVSTNENLSTFGVQPPLSGGPL